MPHVHPDILEQIAAAAWEIREAIASSRWENAEALAGKAWEYEQITPWVVAIVAEQEPEVWENVVMPKKRTEQEPQLEPDAPVVEVVNPVAARTRVVLLADARKATRPQRVGRFACCKQ